MRPSRAAARAVPGDDGCPLPVHAFIPPPMLVTEGSPAPRRMSRPCAERLPERQTTTTWRSAGTSATRPASSPRGMSVAPSMWPAAHSSGCRTSSMKAPAPWSRTASATSISAGSAAGATATGEPAAGAVAAGARVAADPPQAPLTMASNAAAARRAVVRRPARGARTVLIGWRGVTVSGSGCGVHADGRGHDRTASGPNGPFVRCSGPGALGRTIGERWCGRTTPVSLRAPPAAGGSGPSALRPPRARARHASWSPRIIGSGPQRCICVIAITIALCCTRRLRPASTTPVTRYRRTELVGRRPPVDADPVVLAKRLEPRIVTDGKALVLVDVGVDVEAPARLTERRQATVCVRRAVTDRARREAGELGRGIAETQPAATAHLGARAARGRAALEADEGCGRYRHAISRKAVRAMDGRDPILADAAHLRERRNGHAPYHPIG